MSATFVPATTSTVPGFTCLTGFVQRAPQVDIIQRGTHRLVGVGGNVIAALRSNQVNLTLFEGQFVTVCGINEGQIEGVTSLLVTQVFPSFNPQPQPSINLNLLLLLLLLSRFRFPFAFGFPGLGLGGLGTTGLGIPGLGTPPGTGLGIPGAGRGISI